MKPDIILESIENLLNIKLHRAPGETDPLGSLMRFKWDDPKKNRSLSKYTLDIEGRISGLNLAKTGLDDGKWEKILKIPGLDPACLQALNLSDNQLTAFVSAESMKALVYLDVSGNQVSNLNFIDALSGLVRLDYSENPVINPPPEVVIQGLEAIRRHFKRLQKVENDYLFEAKVLLIGRTGAGKTSLRYKLRHPDEQMPKEDETTRGIDVEPLEFLLPDGRVFRMNVWDFEGQQISHQTHQFFLTKRSLYVFVADQRTEKADFDYWLQIVELLGENSPVMIFQNEKKAPGEQTGQICALNLDGMRKRFGHFLCEGEHRANLDQVATGERFLPEQYTAFDSFRAELQKRLMELPIVGTELPRSWVNIRAAIEELASEHAHIPLKEFREICVKNQITNLQDQQDLSRLFHDLGIFLHFQSPSQERSTLLSRMIILQNEWATKAVYQVLKNEWLREHKSGHFTIGDLRRVWAGTDFADHADELLELMMRFEICYQITGSEIYIAPQLLPPSPPGDYHFPDSQDAPRLHYGYDFMPKGLLTRLTVRMHPLIARGQTLAWKDGFVLEQDDSIAEIIETYGLREIHIKVTGKHCRKLLNAIAYEIDRLNATYHFSDRLQVHKLLPCICPECSGDESPHFFKYKEVKIQLEKGWKEIPCGKTANPVLINELLENILENDEKTILDSRFIIGRLNEISREQQTASKKLDKLTSLTERLSESGKEQYETLVEEITGMNDLFFQSDMEQKQFFEKIGNEIKKLDSKEQKKLGAWQDGDIKHKLKISLPLIIFRYEAEMDVNNFKFPRSWPDFKAWFLKPED